MPRKAKEKIEEIEENAVKKVVKAIKKITKKEEKEPTKKKTSSSKSVPKKATSKSEKVEKVTAKKTSSKSKKIDSKADDKKVVTKKTSTKTKKVDSNSKIKKTAAKKTSTSKAKVKEIAPSEKSEETIQETLVVEENPKKTTTKKASTTKKATSSKSVKKATKTTSTKAKSTTAKKATTKKASTKTTKSTKKIPVEVVEYYDLPYRYNQTVVKILAQTPTTLFVYWDISDENKEQYIEKYGTYFFNNTKPVLIVHNKTLNYSFEVDINDFANSWYLNVADSNCDYQVELGRRPINNYVQIENDYLYITTSNDIMSQNDHILFERLSHFIYFRNVKTNTTIKKELTNLSLLQKIGKFDINFIKEFYRKLYPNEVLDFDRLDLRNPSSSNPSSTFK